MMAAFAAKMVFFGAYVAVMLQGRLRVRPVPFVASFTAYFIALYLVEALYSAAPVRGQDVSTTCVHSRRRSREHAAEAATEARREVQRRQDDHRARVEQRPSTIR